MHDYFVNRFDRTFNSSAVQLTVIRGNTFVTINSMAMHMDSCHFCTHAQNLLTNVKHKGLCSLDKTCSKGEDSKFYSSPILLMVTFSTVFFCASDGGVKYEMQSSIA